MKNVWVKSLWVKTPGVKSIWLKTDSSPKTDSEDEFPEDGFPPKTNSEDEFRKDELPPEDEFLSEGEF